MITAVARADAAELVEDEEHGLLPHGRDALDPLRDVSTESKKCVGKAVSGRPDDSIAAGSRWSYARSKAIDGEQEPPQAAALGRAPDGNCVLGVLGTQLPERNLAFEFRNSLRLSSFEWSVSDCRFG